MPGFTSLACYNQTTRKKISHDDDKGDKDDGDDNDNDDDANQDMDAATM